MEKAMMDGMIIQITSSVDEQVFTLTALTDRGVIYQKIGWEKWQKIPFDVQSGLKIDSPSLRQKEIIEGSEA